MERLGRGSLALFRTSRCMTATAASATAVCRRLVLPKELLQLLLAFAMRNCLQHGYQARQQATLRRYGHVSAVRGMLSSAGWPSIGHAPVYRQRLPLDTCARFELQGVLSSMPRSAQECYKTRGLLQAPAFCTILQQLQEMFGRQGFEN